MRSVHNPTPAVSVSKINSSKLRKVNNDDDFHSKDACHFHLIKSDKQIFTFWNKWLALVYVEHKIW